MLSYRFNIPFFCMCVWQRVGCGWKTSFEICIGPSLRARAVCGNNCMACGLILNECSFSPLLSQVIWVCNMCGAEYVVMLYCPQMSPWRLSLLLLFGFVLKEDDCEICWAHTPLCTHFLIHGLEFISIWPLSSVGLVGCSVMRLDRDIYTWRSSHHAYSVAFCPAFLFHSWWCPDCLSLRHCKVRLQFTIWYWAKSETC